MFTDGRRVWGGKQRPGGVAKGTNGDVWKTGPMAEEKLRLIPMKAAIERICCKRTKLYELIKSGIIKAYKMGRQTMVDANTIDAYHATLPPMVSATSA